jgi:hypothetical protein
MRPVDSRREPLPRHGAPSTHSQEGLGPTTGSATDDQRRSRGPSLLGIPGGLAIGIAGGRGSMSKLGRCSGRNGESRNLVVVDSHGRIPSGEQVAQCAI